MFAGNFDADINEILADVRHRDEIRQSFDRNLQQHKETNSRLAEETQNTIFASFTKSVADKLTLTPQYIEEQIALINEELWQVVKWYFEDYNCEPKDCQYLIDDHTKTVTAQTEGEIPELFYYWCGSRNRPYRSLRQYGMGPDFGPHSGRITLTSLFGRNVLDEVYCETGGTLTVSAEIEPCSITLYSIKVYAKANRAQEPAEYFSFLGRTAAGRIIPDNECRKIMELPVVSYTENRLNLNIRKNYNSRNYTAVGMEERGELDIHVPADDFIRKHTDDRNAAHKEEIENLTRKTAIAKTGLEREVNVLKSQIKQTQQEVYNATDRIGKLQAGKRLKILRQELRRREDTLFLDRMRLDLQLEERIKQFIENQRFTAEVTRHYLIEVSDE
ncbi:MAG: hypothetical protein LIO85_05365 [Rikenellaceae bacterium]|nr:hypothetical protein [Rikenellaceae bacterium]